MTEETIDIPAEATPVTEPKAAPVPRAPKLNLMLEGVAHPLLKYPFPVKAARFPITINGAVVDAACTVGRGKAYTYILMNNTSFYVSGVLPPDAACTVEFPEGYKFDEAVTVRVSTYKSKKEKKAEAAAEAGNPVEPRAADPYANEDRASDHEGSEVEQAVAVAQKSKRRGR